MNIITRLIKKKSKKNPKIKSNTKLKVIALSMLCAKHNVTPDIAYGDHPYVCSSLTIKVGNVWHEYDIYDQQFKWSECREEWQKHWDVDFIETDEGKKIIAKRNEYKFEEEK